MPLPLIPIVVTGLVVTSYTVVRKRSSVRGMTPQRQMVFDHAIKVLKDPIKLRALADAFRKDGLKAYADLLDKRAALRELPEDVKEARAKVFKTFMTSTDPVAIHKVADAFSAQGATGAATALRDYAAGLVPNSAITTTVVEEDVALSTAEPLTTIPSPAPVSLAPESPTIETNAPFAEPMMVLDVENTALADEAPKAESDVIDASQAVTEVLAKETAA